jgi:hypothetical protein
MVIAAELAIASVSKVALVPLTAIVAPVSLVIAPDSVPKPLISVPLPLLPMLPALKVSVAPLPVPVTLTVNVPSVKTAALVPLL